MKTKSLFFAALLLIALGACKDNAEIDSDLINSGDDAKGNISLQISLEEGYKTKAVTEPKFFLAADIESYLTNLLITVFDNRGLLETSFIWELDRNIKPDVAFVRNGKLVRPKQEPFDMNDDDHFEVLNLVFEDEVTVGTKYIYATANVPEQYSSSQNRLNPGYSKNRFEQETFRFNTMEDMLFPLTYNEQNGLIANYRDHSSNTNGFLMSMARGVEIISVGEGATTSAELELGRSMVKVYVGSQTPTGEDIDKLYPNGSIDFLGFNLYNLASRMYIQQNVNNDGTIVTPFFDTYSSDNYTSGYSHYFQTEDKWATILNTKANISDYDKDIPVAIYAMENTNRLQLQGNSTYAVVRIKFTPKDIYQINGVTAGTLAGEGTFWRAYDKVEGVYDDRYFEGDPTEAGGIFENNADYEAKAYVGGIGYHKIYLHTNSEFGIYRNHCYRVTIEGVSSAGDNNPDVDPDDKEKPIEETGSIKCTVKVVDWNYENNSTWL